MTGNKPENVWLPYANKERDIWYCKTCRSMFAWRRWVKESPPRVGEYVARTHDKPRHLRNAEGGPESCDGIAELEEDAIQSAFLLGGIKAAALALQEKYKAAPFPFAWDDTTRLIRPLVMFKEPK